MKKPSSGGCRSFENSGKHFSDLTANAIRISRAGGIGSGKTFVAKMFGEEGCLVINSDDMVRRVYHDETVKHTLKQWWGKMIFEPNGEIDR